jgi:hypothetical protein
MSAHQCPRCLLIYTYRTELEFHLREDHEPATPRPDRHEADTDSTRTQPTPNHSAAAVQGC